MTDAPRLLVVGKIRGVHGVRGELKVELFDPSSRALHKGTRLWVGTRAGPFSVLAVREHPPALLVTLSGIGDRDAAQALVNEQISIERPPLSEGEHYLADLVGFSVRTRSGVAVGTMEGEAKGLAQTTLIVRREGRDLLVPAVFLVGVDEAAREVVVDPPEGLLD